MTARRSPTDEPSAPAGAVGHRLAVARKLAGLSRAQLADRAQVSINLLSQVERGDVPASPSLTAATARALGLDVETLHGQPYGPALCDPRADHAGVPALRAALISGDDPQPTDPPLTAVELRARLDECDRDRADSGYAQLSAALPELLQHGYALAAEARPGAEAETAGALLTDAHLLVQTVAYRFGYLDLAMLANLLARSAARASGDPLRVALVCYERGLLRLHRGDYPGVLRIVDRAHTEIADQHSPAAEAVRAQLHLRQAIAHARSGVADRADEHLTAARELIARGVPASPYYNVIATAANVDIHWVAVPVELADAATALTRAEQIKIPTGEEPCRVGHHWIDLARAWTLHGDHTKAFEALYQARAVAPQLTRYHPQAHETLHLLAEHDRRATDTLAGFADWAHITH
ncbi:MAG: helix-turn-helix domain-containing protein [Pseudonocardiaceae bacterium]